MDIKKDSIFIDCTEDGFGVLKTANPSIITRIRGLFTKTVIEFYGRKRVKKQVSVLTPSGRFHPGLWNEIRKQSKYLPIEFVFSENFKKVIRPVQIELDNMETIPEKTYYDYQEDSIRAMFRWGRGIIELGTGGGKSLIMGGYAKNAMAQNPNVKILIMVPGTTLLNQLYASFCSEFGMEKYTTTFTASNIRNFDPDKNIVISNNETLINLEDSVDMFKDFDVVLVDECHTIGNDTKTSNFLTKINTNSKYGLTGTLPDKEIELWNLLGRIGPPIYVKKSFKLREEGYITHVKVNIALLDHYLDLTSFDDPRERYQFEKDYNMRHEKRNKFICTLTKSLNKNCLILVDRIEHGLLLQEELKKIKKTVYFFTGQLEDNERKKIFAEMESCDDICVVAIDKIFSTGISIKNLHHIIFVGIGKSKIKVIQSIGRSLRKNNNKKMAILYDVADTTHYSYNHYIQRKRLYRSEKIPFTEKRFKL